MFGDLDGLVVLADLLSALHQGRAGFTDARSALAAAADALRWDHSWTDWLADFARLKLPPRAIRRVAFAATKTDHIAARQRGNLAALMRRLTHVPDGSAKSAVFAIASVRCTEDVVETLAGRPVSAVRAVRVLQREPSLAQWQERNASCVCFESNASVRHARRIQYAGRDRYPA